MTTETALRAALRREFGPRRYRISGGEIHVFGTMPNTNQDGWYLYGYVGDHATDRNLGISTRGGARPGAGRPQSADAKGRYQVTLSPAAAAIARNLGDGNRSAGIERALMATTTKPPK